jgi:putative heme iron utilization protein
MPEPLPTAAEFDGKGLAKRLLRSVRSGALATLDRAQGFPFASLVTVATDLDGTPLLLLSRLSAHTRNLERDPRASILLSQGGKGDPLAHPRLTVIGTAALAGEPRVRERFLARHPKAALYAGFADFSFWRLEVEAAHLNGGFARAMTLTRAELLTEVADPDGWAALEPAAVAHMNADHREALALYAERLEGGEPGPWRMTGLDPEGIDLVAAEASLRVPFQTRLDRPGDLRPALVAMAQEARSRGP